MFDKIVYNLCDKIISLCEKVKDRIRNTSHKQWLKGYNKWRKNNTK